MGEENLLKGAMYIIDNNGTEVEIGNLTETKLVGNLFTDETTKPYFTTATDASIKFTGTIDTDNEFFKELVEESRKYQAMTRKERTLYHTDGRYDTIICPSEQIKELLTKEFGDLNYVVSELLTCVVLINS